MKIWIKYLLGIALGITAALVVPFESRNAAAVLSFLTDVSVRFGRYTVLPLLFFSVSVAVCKLRASKRILKPAFLIVSVLAVSVCMLTAVGLLSVLVVRLPRIPITAEKVAEVASIDVQALVRRLFPYSGFEAFLDGAFLLPLFLFAGLAGAGCAVDTAASKSAVTLFDSLSTVAYNVMSFFVDMLAIGMIAIACTWAIDSFAVFASGVYVPLLIMLAADFVLVAFVLYPVLLYALCKGTKPMRVLYASICPILVAFFSGDTNLTLPVAVRHGKESLGIQRKINAVTYPVFSVFARGGSALCTTVCFVVILTSYSSLRISAEDVLWIAGMSCVLSFVLGALPSGGPFVALTVMCTIYGRGFEAGYLLLKPAALLICSFAAAIDAATAMFGSYFVAHKMGMTDHYEVRKFI
ncbi:dicarboxylate/amino acid:cation symporter [Treponema brennaborense]|uniref:Transporter, putative n=1 Tax=Treponema brennaborense (strain DSM 12168 / CIP 105900 / DD5/3) TaxID=906968 RepID=F4LLT2_TREBD|nr:cation:dicarboxylase symporter family transporter [Treponema brennaborense]AEE17726.1 transporter, putative [Treponema brennaborense DSM 12168]